MIRSPAFWWRAERGTAAHALSPLGSLVGRAAARRMARPGTRAGVPVICVGNFTLGGAGKTPVAIEIARHLAAAGVEPAFVSRGYGGTARQAPLRVEPDRHAPAEVGDEPLLLARVAPCFVGADRLAGAQAAAAAGADAVVADDGLQNPTFVKDLRVVVVDGAVGVGNGLCLPAGPLRAPLADQWRHVDVLVVVGAGVPGEALLAEAERRRLPGLRAAFQPEPRALAALRDRPLVAFAGIGRPAKFFDTLAAAGLAVARTLPFPDHHRYEARDLARLRAAAAAEGATLVTTEKDRVRLPADFPAAVLPVRLAFDDPDRLADALGRALDGIGRAATSGT